MSFPKYEVYKDSGVEWLGEVPEHWKLMRLRHLLIDGTEGIKIGPFGSQISSDILVESGYKVYGQENIIARNFSKGSRFITMKKFQEMAVYTIKPGDLLITMMGTAGRCQTVPAEISEGIMDSHLLRMRFRELVLTKFIELLIDSSSYIEHQVKLNGKGSIMHGLNSSIVKELTVVLPPVKEQSLLLEFLSYETTRIDALIAEQQRLIELLKEKRQAVISHAVTKGLDPTAPMKDSGIEWLGEVPAHWEITRIGWQCLVGNGCTPSRDNLAYWGNGDYPWLNSSKVNLERVVEADQFVTKQALKECALPIVKPGSVLIAITGEGKTRGMATITKIEVTISQHLAFIERRSKRLSHYYLHNWLSSNYLRLRHQSEGWGSTKAAITCSDIRAFPLPLPPIDEQENICRFIEEKSSLLNELVFQSEENVRLLQERRSALISAAVTGKIDVRGWQAPASAAL